MFAAASTGRALTSSTKPLNGLRRAGGVKFTPPDLRRTCRTLMSRLGVDLLSRRDQSRNEIRRVVNEVVEAAKNRGALGQKPVDLLDVGGENGELAVFDRSGKLLHGVAYPGRVDQCSWEPSRGWLACAGGGITLYSFDGASDPKLLATLKVSPGLHTNAIDPSTGTIWAVWSDRATGAATLQGFTYKP